VRGLQGVIERNAMRYYFAIQSYLNTQEVEKSKRFESRISSWFDLTEKYHKQLYELDKPDYLKYKKMERKDQIRLQKAIKSIPNICRET
jgi:RNase P subunit RPR2